MKILALFVFFILLAFYYLDKNNKIEQNITMSVSKKLGQRSAPDLVQLPYKLQRVSIDTTPVITFKKLDHDDVYELVEDELQDFSKSLQSMKGLNDTDPSEFTRLPTYINNEEKNYYELSD